MINLGHIYERTSRRQSERVKVETGKNKMVVVLKTKSAGT